MAISFILSYKKSTKVTKKARKFNNNRNVQKTNRLLPGPHDAKFLIPNWLISRYQYICTAQLPTRLLPTGQGLCESVMPIPDDLAVTCKTSATAKTA